MSSFLLCIFLNLRICQLLGSSFFHDQLGHFFPSAHFAHTSVNTHADWSNFTYPYMYEISFSVLLDVICGISTGCRVSFACLTDHPSTLDMARFFYLFNKSSFHLSYGFLYCPSYNYKWHYPGILMHYPIHSINLSSSILCLITFTTWLEPLPSLTMDWIAKNKCKYYSIAN